MIVCERRDAIPSDERWRQESRALHTRKANTMCTNGINTGQFGMMVEQLDDQLAVNRRWAHKLAHAAGDAGFSQTDDALHKVQELLDDARALLSDAKDAIESDAEAASGVSVELV